MSTGAKQLREQVAAFSDALGLVFERWNVLILYVLHLGGRVSFNVMQKALGVNSRTLSDRLKVLVELGFVVRVVVAGPPVRVLYSLGDRGKAVIEALLPLLGS